jgi:hypothetical protein
MDKTIATQPGTEVTAKDVIRKRTTAKQFRKKAKTRIEENYEAILDSLVGRSIDGSIQHTKLLFDLGGVKEELEESSKERKLGPSLGRLLLKDAAEFRKRKETEKAARLVAAAADPSRPIGSLN